MLDLSLIRQDPERVTRLCLERRCDVDVNYLLQLDAEFREITKRCDELRHELKSHETQRTREDARKLKSELRDLDAKCTAARQERDALWHRLPNLLAPDTPLGEDDSDNVELHRFGAPVDLGFVPKTHEVIGSALGILDLERGARVAGAGFYYWRGDGARLAWALYCYALRFLSERGFTHFFTPVLAREKTFFGTGYLPFSQGEIYRIAGEDLCLIGTSEQTLVGFHMEQQLDDAVLPLKYMAFTPCFRTEAGSYGKKSRGAFRVHQFHKVEQIIFCRPEESDYWHEQCQTNVNDFMKSLGLYFRIVRVCAGDLGAPAYKKYDTEAWFHGYGEFRETHSNSNLLDYQTRRLDIRCSEGTRKYYPHTISSTMVTDRTALAILEAGQQADGTIAVPGALQPFFCGGSVKASTMT